jgi:uncharacterized membrane protein YesL
VVGWPRKAGVAWAVIRLSLSLFYRRIGLFLVGNVLWILTSLPLLTLPAATGALFYLAHRVVRDERDLDDAATIDDFWVGFRRYWRRSSILWLLDMGALLVLLISLLFYLGSSEPILNWFAGPIVLFLLIWLAMQLYLFSLLIVYEERSLREVLRLAFALVLSYPLQSFLLVFVMILVIIASLILAGPVLLLLFSFLALLQTVALRIVRVEQREIPPAKKPEEK